MRGALLPLVLLAVASGCLQGEGAPPTPASPTPEAWPEPREIDGIWRLTACGLAPPTGADPPDLIVGAAGASGDVHVERLAWTGDGYMSAARSDAYLVKPEPYVAPYALVAAPGGAYAYGASRAAPEPAVLRLDDQMKVVARADVDEFASMTYADDRVYVAGSTLRVYDTDLRLLGEVELPLKESYAGKLAHDVIVQDDVAFLIDDVVVPLYILRVDVSDPRAPRVIDRQDLSGGHLPGHWVDPRAQRWYVLGTWGGMGGGYQSLHALPLARGGVDTEWTLSTTSYHPATGADRTTTGLHILAQTDLAPAWVVAAREDRAFLGRFEPEMHEDQVDFCAVDVDLAWDDDSRAVAHLDRGEGAIAGVVGDTIFVLREDGPSTLAVQRWLAPVHALVVAS